MRMLDLFSGELGWASVFAARGWKVTAVDLKRPRREIPKGVEFVQADVMTWEITHPRTRIMRLYADFGGYSFDFPDFICASSVCDGFASFGMPHYRKNPPHPVKEIKLFEHTRRICDESGVPYVMENVRTAQQFVGPAIGHCGSFYLWGNAVPPILPQGITKAKWKPNVIHGRNAPGNFAPELNWPKAERKAKLATIPPELAHAVAEYAERLIEAKVSACQ